LCIVDTEFMVPKEENIYIEVLLPLAVPNTYTYLVPDELKGKIQRGQRVEVELRRKLYSGICVKFTEQTNFDYKPKPVIGLIDETPILSEKQLQFWEWISKYYLCKLGEVMKNALPSALKLESETLVVMHPEYGEDFSGLSDEEYLVAEAVLVRQKLRIDEIKDILNKKTIYPVLNSLIAKSVLVFYEDLQDKFRPKKIRVIQLHEVWENNDLVFDELLESVSRSVHQRNILQCFRTMSKEVDEVPVSEVIQMSGANYGALAALVKKQIIEIQEKQINRLAKEIGLYEDSAPLTMAQQNACSTIREFWQQDKPGFIWGVTGSGKTRIYIELIRECIDQGRQCLYLLPEIALTSQIIDRLELVFGKDVLTYHSRMNDQERVEVWNEVLHGRKIVLGARSSIFLPFQNLGLIIVDEEHDPSYKQSDPAPRYQARDLAHVLAKIQGSNVLLGSATPSIETYLNALSGKYSMVRLTERYGDVAMPEIELLNLAYERKTGRLKKGTVSFPLKEAIEDCLNRKKQVILFLNKRAYSSILQCSDCGWISGCKKCDISLNYHKFSGEMKCHYCGYRLNAPVKCPSCDSTDIQELGVGTERLEEEIRNLFPTAIIDRMDTDTAGTKSNLQKIIADFSLGTTDILVGTQMIAKGFDFDNVELVGVINADALIRIPDFRSSERAFQLLLQVGGRAGRRQERGKVLIQTYDVGHPLLIDILANDEVGFYHRELSEREMFLYPPYYRLIYLDFSHAKKEVVAEASEYAAVMLKKIIGQRIIGPAEPAVPRIANKYLMQLVVKIEKQQSAIVYVKEIITKSLEHLSTQPQFKSVRVKVNVDP
jgi:primosomal protein N' (replication factor Y) (superfamily II helicase)